MSIQNLSFHNLTPKGTIIPDNLKSLLGLNLNFCPTPRQPTSKMVYKQALEEMKRSLRLKLMFQGKDNCDYNRKIYVPNRDFEPDDASEDVENLLRKIDKNLIDFKPKLKTRIPNLNREMREMISILQSRPDLRIVQTDKNLGPAIMTTEGYKQLALEHLGDTVTYTPVTEPVSQLIPRLRNIVSTFYAKIVQYKNKETDIIIDELNNKKLNYFHGLPKIHKVTKTKPLKPRPIISNTNGIFDGLSKYLDFKLAPYLKYTESYLKDSGGVIDLLKTIHPFPGQTLYTFDVVSMYSNIDAKDMIKAISSNIQPSDVNNLLMEGLDIVMNNNYFTFGKSVWHQRKGTAMGTAVAPFAASYYLAVCESPVIEKYKTHIVCYKRFIDDGFIIWSHLGNENSFIEFLADLSTASKLEFTHVDCKDDAEFLDLHIIRTPTAYITRTHQKDLNLYLYIPATSAHPPSILKGLIFGRVLQYKKQNTRHEDYIHMCTKLSQRLIARGYTPDVLQPIFDEAMNRKSQVAAEQKQEQLFLKLPYDPYGPSRSELSEVFLFDDLEPTLNKLNISKVTICHKKPSSLASMLSSTKFFGTV